MQRLRQALARTTDPHQFDLVPTGSGDVLDIGCGNAKTPGAVGLDISADTDADVVHDLDLWLPFRATGIAALANRFPQPHEAYFAFRFPTMNIRAEFEVTK